MNLSRKSLMAIAIVAGTFLLAHALFDLYVADHIRACIRL
jgi:hypothetical protein